MLWLVAALRLTKLQNDTLSSGSGRVAFVKKRQL